MLDERQIFIVLIKRGMRASASLMRMYELETLQFLRLRAYTIGTCASATLGSGYLHPGGDPEL